MDSKEYEEMGKRWLAGEIVIEEFGEYKFHAKQIDFLNEKSRSTLACGGMASGKTLPFIVKLILFSLWFPGSKHLVGRKTKENAQETFMKDFMEVCPPELYTHQKGYGKITFFNGSEVEFWGLDALQSGATTDIKKAEQKLKSHNFSFIWVDQLEEIEKKVFDALHSRMRRAQCTHKKDRKVFRDREDNPIYELCSKCGRATFNQFNATTNPANFWGYAYFKSNPMPMTALIESSMLDNRENLSDQYIESELQKPKRYVQKYVHGEWSPDSLVESAVFYEEHIKEQEYHVKKPIKKRDGVEYFEEPERGIKYQIGVDPSIGATDPCAIKVIRTDTGAEVASFSGFVPTNVIGDRTIDLAEHYNRALIVPEVTGVGQALVEYIKGRYSRIYEREVFSNRTKTKTKKLGFYTNAATKTQLIEHAKLLLQKKFIKIRDKATVEELKTFIYTDEVRQKGAGAQNGYHDDRVMALLLALWNVQPTTRKEKNLLDRLRKTEKKQPVQYQFT